MKERTLFCTKCRRDMICDVVEKEETRLVKGKQITYQRMTAYCNHCNCELFLEELEDENYERLDEIYRKSENLITIKEIECILKKYNVEKRPLSKLLGLGELTLTKYLEGQLPSKRYSRLLLEVLQNTDYAKELFEANRENVVLNTYQKVVKRIERLEALSSSMIQKVAYYIVDSAFDITNLSLQKILYYVQACSLTFYNKPIFNEDCEAWVHGPVYPQIYDQYKEFGKCLIDNTEDYVDVNFEDSDKELVDDVLNVFGIYNGKILENLTHMEDPWKNARTGYNDDEVCKEIISKTSIKNYFNNVKDSMNITNISAMNDYIIDIIRQSKLNYYCKR